MAKRNPLYLRNTDEGNVKNNEAFTDALGKLFLLYKKVDDKDKELIEEKKREQLLTKKEEETRHQEILAVLGTITQSKDTPKNKKKDDKEEKEKKKKKEETVIGKILDAIPIVESLSFIAGGISALFKDENKPEKTTATPITTQTVTPPPPPPQENVQPQFKRPDLVEGNRAPTQSTPTQTSGQSPEKTPPQFKRPDLVPSMPSTASATKVKPGELIMPKEDVAVAIDKASKQVGVDKALMYAIAKQESSFESNAGSGTSSAKGLFQFISSTWSDTVRKYVSKYPVLRKGPQDPEANALAGALLIKDNSNLLAKNGIPVNATTIYATHFLGPKGGTELLTADNNKNAVNLFPKAAHSNPWIFYESKKQNGKNVPDLAQPRTGGKIKEVLFQKVGQFQEKYAQALNAPSTGTQLAAASTENKDLKKTQKQTTEVAMVNNVNNTILQPPNKNIAVVSQKGSRDSALETQQRI